MSLNGYSLRIAAEKLGIHRNTLTNYMGQDLIPRVNLEGLVLVPEPTMKNLLWMQSRGIPLTKYLFTDLPHDDGFKDLQHKKGEESIYRMRQELHSLYGGRQNVKYGERYYQEISSLQRQIEQKRKHQDKILGNFSKPTNSGMGDSATMDPDTKYVEPEFLQLWGEPEEGAYKVEPFMYVGTPDDKNELLKELQDTIAEQEQKLETEYRRDKANNLKLFELKELLKEKQEEVEKLVKTEYRQNVNMVEQLEKYDTLVRDFNKLNKNWDTKYKEAIANFGFTVLERKSKSKPIDNIEQTNATPIDNKDYTREEEARLGKMLDDLIKGQNLPK